MKAISIHQPWSSLIALGEKHYETRNWKPQHRGPIIIHASKSFSKPEQALLQTEPFKSVLARHGIESITQLPTGRPIAIATLKDAYMVEEITDKLTATERDFGDFRAGRYAWCLENIIPLREPIQPVPGRQSIFEIPDDILAACLPPLAACGLAHLAKEAA
jgi:hypothetical protein